MNCSGTLCRSYKILLLLCSLFLHQVIVAQGNLLSELVINEIAPINDHFPDEYGEFDDWIEIHNGDVNEVWLDDIYVTDDFNEPLKWKIDGPHKILPGGFLLLWMDGEPHQGVFHAPFKLKSSGEQVAITQIIDNEVVWIDSITYGPVLINTTLGRISDGDPPFALLSEMTPGQSNNGALMYMVEPQIQPPGMIIEGLQEIAITAPDTVSQIHYTLDGSEPTTMSNLYDGPFLIDTTLQINAKSFKTGYSGATSRETYILNPSGTLPTLSLELPREDLFHDEKGIYVLGTNGTEGYCVGYPANWNQDWEKAGRITMFEPNGLRAFSVNAGIKIGGGCSRGLNMKSFNLYFRNKYGDPYIPYRIFSESEISEYHRIKIRNAGTDNGSMMLRDGINQLLFRGELDMDMMDYKPAVLYLNSEFWGVYGIREFINEDYIESHHGFKKNEIDLIKSPYSWKDVKVGSDSAFVALTTFIGSHDLALQENYNYVADLIDINEFVNYNIAQIYLANYDWPSINTYVWKPKNSGKWRWILFDTDGSTNFDLFYDTYPSYNSMRHAAEPMFETWPNSEESTMVLKKLFENDEFRNEFAQRTSTYIKLLFHPERVDHLTDSLIALIDPYVDPMLEKWGENIPELGWGLAMGGSREKWEENIALYKEFFVKRPAYLQAHISDYFRLTGTYTLNLNHNESSHGSVHVNSNRKKLPHGFHADYFKDIPLKLLAIPEEGYTFDRWLETDDPNPEIEFIGNSDVTLTPLFILATSVPDMITTEITVYPNPTSGMINIRFESSTDENIDVTFYNSNGQELISQTLRSNAGSQTWQFDLSTLQNGVYMVRINSNLKQKVEKFILIQ